MRTILFRLHKTRTNTNLSGAYGAWMNAKQEIDQAKRELVGFTK